MAVVESAADGLAMTLPALGLSMPRNFSHLSGDPDLDQSQHQHQEQDRFHLHHHHHHHHLHHHNNHLQQQQHLQKQQHLGLGQKTQTELPLQQKSLAENLKLADGQLRPNGQTLASGESLTLTSGESVTLASGQNVADGKTLTPASGQTITLASGQTLTIANGQALADGKTLNLAIGLPFSETTTNANPQKQFGTGIMHELEDPLSKLNPLAEEFVPSSLLASDAPNGSNRKKKNGYTPGRRRANGRTSKAQQEECVRRTVYVSDIDQQVTEEHLAALFITCGQVVDCRVCGDPNSVLRFAFVEFTDEEGARAALGLAGTMLGYYPVRVLPSKTAIIPVNPTFLPRSEDEREMCARTVYCTNIDKKVSQTDVKLFFEPLCGEVARLRLLGDYRHTTRIAFVEFVLAESAMAALNCSGAILGSLPVRVSPSKTPVRPRSPRLLSQ